MSIEFPKTKKEKHTYTLVIIPSRSGESQRTVSFTLWKGIFLGGLILLLAFGIIIGGFIWTPLGTFLPEVKKKNNEHTLVQELQTKLSDVHHQLDRLREYNIQMRSILGQKISREDSLFLFTQRSNPEREQHILETVEANRSASFSSGFGKFSSALTGTSMMDFPLVLPTRGYISRRFENQEGHFGIDFAGKEGTLITAPADGYVLFSAWEFDFGNTIILAHRGGYITVYKHTETLLASAFTEVKRGEAIATLGNSGRLSSGPHLHFELWKNGIALDPEIFLLQSKQETSL